MKRILNSIAGIVLVAGALSGCEKRVDHLAHANRVHNKGQPKVLTINLSPNSTLIGPERRFYDTDGDGKTVEQYMEFYSATAGWTPIQHVQKNLLRPGAKEVFEDSRILGDPREMTPEEMKALDAEYQRLIAGNKF